MNKLKRKVQSSSGSHVVFALLFLLPRSGSCSGVRQIHLVIHVITELTSTKDNFLFLSFPRRVLLEDFRAAFGR